MRYTFSNPGDPHGTGWILSDASTGRHRPYAERHARSQAISQPVPAPKIALPLDLNEAQQFVNEVRPPHRNVALDMVVGGVLSAALVRAVQHRRAL